MKKLFVILICLLSIAAEYPSFEARTPDVESAQAEKTYPLMWLQGMTISAPSPTEPVQLELTFIPYRQITDANGNITGVEVKSGGSIREHVNDVFALAEQDSEFKQTVTNFLSGVQKFMIRRGYMKGNPS